MLKPQPLRISRRVRALSDHDSRWCPAVSGGKLRKERNRVCPILRRSAVMLKSRSLAACCDASKRVMRRQREPITQKLSSHLRSPTVPQGSGHTGSSKPLPCVEAGASRWNARSASMGKCQDSQLGAQPTSWHVDSRASLASGSATTLPIAAAFCLDAWKQK